MLIGKNLKRRKGRTVMTIAAVSISMALLISMLAIAEGIWVDAVEDLEKSKEDILVVSGGEFGGVLYNGHELTNKFNSDTSNISVAAPFLVDILIAQPTITPTNSTTNDNTDADEDGGMVIALGVIPEYFEGFLDKDKNLNLYGFEVKFKDWFEEEGDPHYENNYSGPYTYEILIDEILAKNYGLKKGSKLNLSKAFPSISELTGSSTSPDISDLSTSEAVNASKELTFVVKGFFESNFEGGGFYGEFFKGNIILHLSELQSLKNLDIIQIENRTIIKDEINGISIAVTKDIRESNKIDSVAQGIQEQYPYYKALTKSDQLKMLEDQVSIARIYYTAIGSVAIIIGLLFVTCIMIISVYERTQEIGMLRAIGISRRTIFTQVLSESLMIVVIGSILGLIPGYFGSIALSDYLSQNLGVAQDFTAFTPNLIISSLSIILVVGGLVSLYPAWRASHMKVVEALHHRG
jgi:ABC-type antimicrobial peptide transport system permease subunit